MLISMKEIIYAIAIGLSVGVIFWLRSCWIRAKKWKQAKTLNTNAEPIEDEIFSCFGVCEFKRKFPAKRDVVNDEELPSFLKDEGELIYNDYPGGWENRWEIYRGSQPSTPSDAPRPDFLRVDKKAE